MEPITVCDLRLIISAAPTLWTGRIGGRGSIAIHYRWGGLTVRVSHTSDDPYAKDSEVIFDAPIGEREDAPGREGDSCIGETQMKEALRDICVFASEGDKKSG